MLALALVGLLGVVSNSFSPVGVASVVARPGVSQEAGRHGPVTARRHREEPLSARRSREEVLGAGGHDEPMQDRRRDR